MMGFDSPGFLRVSWAWAGFVLTGCGSMTFVVQEYAGPPRPHDGIAIIRVNGSGGPDVVAVDDQPLRVALEPLNRIHVEVLPGPHEVDVEVTEPEIGLRHTLPIRFLAAAGKVYRVEVFAVAPSAPARGEARWDAQAYEVDRSTDARLGVAAAWGAPARAPTSPPAGPEVPAGDPELDEPAPARSPDAAPQPH
jgi:hypothetical protein